MNIKIVFALIALININFLFAQSNKGWLDNDKFKYKVVRVSLQLKTKEKVVPSRYLVVSELPDSIKGSVRKLGKDVFLKMLSDEKSDWATNLFLYETFEKDAFLFMTVKSKEQWRLSLKAKDTAFWKAKLSSLLQKGN